jgi:hypothetical protein
MPITLELESIIAIVGILITLAGLLIEHFYFQGALRERIATVEQKLRDLSDDACDLNELCQDVREIKTKTDLFWGALEAQIPGMLLKGNPIPEGSELFQLLQKFTEHQITQEEINTLVALLDQEASNPGHSTGEILAIVLLKESVKAKLLSSGGGIWTYSSVLT